MTDIEQGAPPAGETGEGQAPGGGIRVLGQFIRDLSFENPNAPQSMAAGGAQPQMDVGVEMNVRGRQDGFYEVDLKISTTANRDSQTVFHCEIVYGGLFELNGVAEADIEPVLMIECPRLLFPFVRQIIAEMTIAGGFPPFLLDPLDFVGIYMSQRGQQAQLSGEPAGNA